jgi:hypothetical protein
MVKTMTPAESARRSAAALDKLRSAENLDPRQALATITNAVRGHVISADATQIALNDLRRRVDELTARRDEEAAAERVRMSQRLGGTFKREVER